MIGGNLYKSSIIVGNFNRVKISDSDNFDSSNITQSQLVSMSNLKKTRVYHEEKKEAPKVVTFGKDDKEIKKDLSEQAKEIEKQIGIILDASKTVRGELKDCPPEDVDTPYAELFPIIKLLQIVKKSQKKLDPEDYLKIMELGLESIKTWTEIIEEEDDEFTEATSEGSDIDEDEPKPKKHKGEGVLDFIDLEAEETKRK